MNKVDFLFETLKEKLRTKKDFNQEYIKESLKSCLKKHLELLEKMPNISPKTDKK